MRSAAFVLFAPVFAFAAHGAAPGIDWIKNQPLRFEPAGARDGAYIAHAPGYVFRAKASENEITWFDSGVNMSVRTTFLHARGSARIEPDGLLASYTNYFIGSSSRAWRTNVENFGALKIRGIYPGIDLIYYGSSGALEYDFILHPGSDPRAIMLKLDGVAPGRIDANGSLIVAAQVRWNVPRIYQEIGGKRVRIDGRFEIDGERRVRFHIGRYDHSHDLVIDPQLGYSSYVGGSDDETARGLATDPQGNVYLAGVTSSSNLPVLAGAFRGNIAGQANAFLAKFTSAGKLVYMTYLGGGQIDAATSLSVDAAGNAYVSGLTTSPDFPVTPGAFQIKYGGSRGGACWQPGDGFVAKLNATGSQLVYSTFLGGKQDDIASAVAVDSAGNAYVTGYTISTDFPTTAGAYQTSFAGAGGQTAKPNCNGMSLANPQPWFVSGDAFVSKLNATGSQLVFSTYLGGALDDFGLAIALDSAQNVYVGGFTLSQNFPTTAGAIRTKFGGSEIQNMFFTMGDGFITKLNKSGASLLFSTYLGGSGDDAVTALAAAPDGSVWATGATSSTDFPITSPAIQSTYAGYTTLPFLVEQLVGDAFATHLSSDGTKLLYSTYLGGSANDMGISIAVDAAGLVYVAGFTDSFNFPLTANAVQRRFGGDGGQAHFFQFGDGFIALIDPVASKLVYSSFFGGSQDDQIWGIALDGSGGVWATGNTLSKDLPVTPGAFQPVNAGAGLDFSDLKGDSLLAHFTGLAPSGPVIAALQNSASSASGIVSPGMVFTLYGSGIGPAALTGASLDANGRLATTQAGVSITFDGNPAPIVYVSNGQVAGVAPYEIAGNTSTQVVVQYNGQNSAPFTVPVASTAPGLFSVDFSGSGRAVAFNQDTSLNSDSNPAPKGSIVTLFGTGEGQTNPSGVDGQIAMPGLLPAPAASCTATVGGIPANVLYCGAVPFVVEGELQLNLQLSPNTPSGDQPVVVTIGSAKSQPSLTIAIQ